MKKFLLYIIIGIFCSDAYSQNNMIVGDTANMKIYRINQEFDNYQSSDSFYPFTYKINIPSKKENANLYISALSPLSGHTHSLRNIDVFGYNIILSSTKLTDSSAVIDLAYDSITNSYQSDTSEYSSYSILTPKSFRSGDTIITKDESFIDTVLNLFKRETWSFGLPRSTNIYQYYWVEDSLDKNIVFQVSYADSLYYGWIKMDLTNGGDYLNVKEIAIPIAIAKPYSKVIDTSFCENDSIFILGNYLAESTVLYDTLTAHDGIDSIITYNVIKNALPYINLGNDTIITTLDTLLLDAGNNMQNYMWNTDSSDQFIEVIGADEGVGLHSYSAQVIDSNNCLNTDYLDVLVKMYQVSTTIDTSFCENDSIFLAGIYISEEVTLFDTTNYNNLIDSIFITNISKNLLPIINLGNDTTITTLDSVLLNAGSGFINYIWDSGFSGQEYQINGWVEGWGNHKYSVIVTDANFCNNSDSINIYIQKSEINSIIDTSFCANDSIYIAGRYILDGVTIVDTINYENLIDSIITYYIIKKELPSIYIINDTTITTMDTIQLDAGEGFNFYLWSNGITDQSIELFGNHLGIGTHSFSVYVVGENSCSNTASVNVNVVEYISIVDNDDESTTVFPNPTLNTFKISGNNYNKIRITDIKGNIVLQKEFNNNSEIDLNHLQTGYYYVQVYYTKQVKVFKLLKL